MKRGMHPLPRPYKHHASKRAFKMDIYAVYFSTVIRFLARLQRSLTVPEGLDFRTTQASRCSSLRLVRWVKLRIMSPRPTTD